MTPKDKSILLNWLAEIEQVPTQIDKLTPPKLGQDSDDGVNRLKRRNTMATQITCEVERTETEVQFIVGSGKNRTVYKLTAELAKSIGEELFKAGANLAQAQENRKKP